ncbi:hypothetical protein Tdes44962_MAKER02693 [Teratosphaeria destructans]|uniref:Polynucleotide 5'-hydroxyl-kinase GRC3 n=1 Tax=Teratosphaeria destructans TaxID=418781 RepID=A0A9W7SSS9_9PEZI|nr:hypothetical protein Tdes44962_MAKER02693 [Teratosphaeria destructans]
MALPGLSLPGLGLQSTLTPVNAGNAPLPPEHPPRREDLAAQTEWRFEAAFGKAYSIKLMSGNAELFGIELAPGQLYDLSGTKGAIFTWQGCQLEVTGEADSEYKAEETDYAVEWLNLHGMLETARDDASHDGGPRVLVVGPDSAGKSSLVRTVAAWAVKVGRTPTIVNLDSRDGLLSPPSSLTAVTLGSQMDLESGYGISPISGTTVTPIKTPVVYHVPHKSATEKPDIFKALVTRLALTVTNKLEADPDAKRSGIIIDTPGSLNDPKSNYDLINHIISEFSIDLVLSIGAERLYNDLNRRYSTGKPANEALPVLRLSKPGGAVELDGAFKKQLMTSQIKQYFFGNPSKEALQPHSHLVNFGDPYLFRAKTCVDGVDAQDDDDDDYDPASTTSPTNTIYDKIEPSMGMTGSLLAIKYVSGKSSEDEIRDSPVMGYVYVAEVDEARKKLRLLAPEPQRWADQALVWGTWPDAVADIVK